MTLFFHPLLGATGTFSSSLLSLRSDSPGLIWSPVFESFRFKIETVIDPSLAHVELEE